MRRQVFGRFVRVGDELERTKPGTGLGLFLVRSVIKKMKGKIALLDTPRDSGAKFEVQLPKASLLDSLVDNKNDSERPALFQEEPKKKADNSSESCR